jgi:hypothetical protein
MKSFVSATFFLAFEQVVRAANPKLALDIWSDRGVEWDRARHSFTGSTYSYALEVFVATHDDKDSWKLIVAKEQWWAGRERDVIKMQQWARPLQGKRASILAWFAARQRELDK